MGGLGLDLTVIGRVIVRGNGGDSGISRVSCFIYYRLLCWNSVAIVITECLF